MPDFAKRIPIEVAESHFEKINKYEYSYSVKKTSGSARVFYEDGGEQLFCNRKYDRKFLTTISCVISNAKKFASLNKNLPKLKQLYIVNYCSPNVIKHQDEEIALTDAKICYPTVALNLGIITPETYKRICEYSGDDKKKRQMCIGVMAMTYTYEEYVKGKLVSTKTVFKSEELKRAHNLILQECDNMMYDLIKLLGKDFLMFMTDCVYYVKTPENIKKVHDYFESKNLEFADFVANLKSYSKEFNRIHWDSDGDKKDEAKYYPVGINHLKVQNKMRSKNKK